MPLMLASPAIPPSGEIPSQYTCDGADISPPLTWSGLPSGTQSLIVVVEDPDAPSGVFHHWAAFSMPAGSLHRPFIVLLEEDRTDKAGDGVLVGEDADDLGAALDLAVEPLQRIGGMDLRPVIPRFREGRLLGKLMKARTSASASSIRAASFASLGLS
jgi:hypothetical protein